MMSSISRLIVALFMLTAMVSWTLSQEPVKLNGSEGLSLLANLASGHLSLNNRTQNLNNSTQSPTAVGSASGDLWPWGSRPKDPPWEHEEEVDYINESDLLPA